MKYIVITTINGATNAVKKFADIPGWHLLLIGDQKTPKIDPHPYRDITYLSLERQKRLNFSLCGVLPSNHYSRKNIGYLYALRQGATVIADGDDDNFPYKNWGQNISVEPREIDIVTKPGVVNIYQLFTNELIWPRGFPLTQINKKNAPQVTHKKKEKILIWQGLVDREPDVDAIYRLTMNKRVNFNDRKPVGLAREVFCPFNSQNTIWFPDAFPYLFLPTSVDFRFTDILRGYIAQRGIWQTEGRLAFTASSAYQERNKHNLMKDFKNEMNCYLQVNKVIQLLKNCNLSNDPLNNLQRIYSLLYKADIVKKKEMQMVKAWTKDIKNLI